MSFIETRLLESLSYGFSGGPTWRTNKVSLRSGITRRNISRERPLHRFQGSFDLRNEEVVAVLLNAFNATRGGAYGFRFKNWFDYRLIDQPLGTGTGAAEQYQLVKTYTFGSESVVVPLRKPNNDLVVKANDVVVSHSVDTTTGLVTLAATDGHVLTVTGTYDIPVMFENDEFAGSLLFYEATTIEVQLEEDLAA